MTLLNAGGCWKMLRWRVRVAMRLNHCLVLGESVSDVEPGVGGRKKKWMEGEGMLT